jgi:hypothetical protein
MIIYTLRTIRFQDRAKNGNKIRPILPCTYRLSTAKYPRRFVMIASNPGIILAEEEAKNVVPAEEANSNIASGLFIPEVATDVAIAATEAAVAGFQKDG